MKKIIIQVNKIIICLEIQSVKKVSVISETFHKLTIQKFSKKIVSLTPAALRGGPKWPSFYLIRRNFFLESYLKNPHT